MDRVKLAIESLKTHIDYDKRANGMQTGVITISIAEAETLLALLKEPEAKQIDLYGNDEWWGLVCVCPDCNAEWMTDKANTHYCPNCGIRVKWE